MAGESVRVESPWVEILPNTGAIGNGVFAGPSASIAAVAGLSAAERTYELVEFELVVTGTPVAGSTVTLFRRPNGNGAGQAPDATYRHQVIDQFTLKAASGGSYYIYGEVLEDAGDDYYIENVNGGSLTFVVNARTKTSAPAT